MANRHIPPETKARYMSLRQAGFSQAQAARETGLSVQTAHRIDHNLGPGQNTFRDSLKAKRVPDPISYEDLSPEARRAHDDFGYFSFRYLAREPVPWREVAASRLVQALEDPDRSYLQLCCPPGVGKTSLVLDLTLWSLIRNRGLRGLLGAETLSRSEDYLRFCKRLLSATTPHFDHISKREAEGVLSLDFGRLRPVESEGDAVLWRKDAIIVAQHGDVDLSSKEPSVQIASRDSGFLGSRFDLALWDDLQTLRNYLDASLRTWWTTEAETRMEPKSVLALVGTRVSPDDLFAFNMDRKWTDDANVERPLYQTFVFPARNGDVLLDPKRLSASDLAKRENEPHFQSVYMQDPASDSGGLIEPLWIQGGRDGAGEQYVGCLDLDRRLGEYPAGVDNLITYASVDPALSSGWWGVEVFATPPALVGVRYLIDAVRKQMRPDEFLGIGSESGQLLGLMAEMQIASKQAGRPIQVWVLEVNLVGEQILSSNAFKMFERSFGIPVLAHRTQTNKRGQAGVEALIPPLVRSGRLRIPWAGVEARNVMRQLQLELVGYPNAKTSDLLMALWVAELNIAEVLHRAERPQGEVPFIDLRGMPEYLRRERDRSLQTRKPRPVPAALGSYGAAQPFGGPPLFDRFARTPEITRDGRLAVGFEEFE